MPLHPLAERFAAVAGEYERGRPDYPPAAIDLLARELRLSPVRACSTSPPAPAS